MSVAVRIELDAEDVLGLGEAMRAGWREMLLALTEELVQYAQHVMQDEIRAADLVNTGHLLNHISAQVGIEGSGAGSMVRGDVVPEAAYARVMDEGRRPGAAPPPTAPIALWAKRKLGLSDEAAQRAAYVIARSIGRKGIVGRGFMAKTLAKVEAEAEAIATRHLERFLGEAVS